MKNKTQLLSDDSIVRKFSEALSILKNIDIDGETAELLLIELGINDQVYGQLIGENSYLVSKKTWDDIHNNDTLTFNNFDEYFNYTFIDD